MTKTGLKMATTTKTWQNFIKNQTGSEGGLAKEQTYSVFSWGSSLTNRIEYGNPFNELNELVLFYRLLHRRPPCQALVRDSCPGGADYPAVIFIFSTLIFVTKHFDICRVTLTNICNFDIWSRFPCCVFYIFHFILDSCVFFVIFIFKITRVTMIMITPHISGWPCSFNLQKLKTWSTRRLTIVVIIITSCNNIHYYHH